MKKIITYGTFDLLHQGHINLLQRAKALGNYLIVGVTSENYDYDRGKLNVQQSLVQRIENVKSLNLADEIIVEEYFGQKINDIKKYNIDAFVIGSDWIGKFDYLKEYCDVVYLERTKDISSTKLRNEKNSILRLGIVGAGRIANRFVVESKYVSGVNIESVFSIDKDNAMDFAQKHELNTYSTDYNSFLKNIDAVYIATPHKTHFEYAKQAILQNKHVLCEKPMSLNKREVKELFDLSQKHNVIVLEAIKTAYAPGFLRLNGIAKSGIIGDIISVDATFTKLITDKKLREYNKNMAGGSVTELSSYPLCAIAKLLGVNYKYVKFDSIYDEQTGVDIFTKINLKYNKALATATIGIGAKTEGDLKIGGTKGYIYVPSPWWKTEYFEVRFEDPNKKMKFFANFDGDGLRYELSDFMRLINKRNEKAYKLTPKESLFIVDIIENFKDTENE